MPQTRAMELPPRARRIHLFAVKFRVADGTTSACAENTDYGFDEMFVGGNYLRVRGEYSLPPRLRWSVMELPPRARRIHTPMA